MKNDHIKIQLEGDTEILHRVIPAEAARKISRNAKFELLNSLLIGFFVLLVAMLFALSLYTAGNPQAPQPGHTRPVRTPALPAPIPLKEETEKVPERNQKQQLKRSNSAGREPQNIDEVG